MTRSTTITTGVAVLILVGAALAIVVRLAERERNVPARCPPGLFVMEARCCGEGQRLVEGRCTGTPAGCADGMHAANRSRPGCVAIERRVAQPGGSVRLGASDWDGQTALSPREMQSAPFQIDAVEVTVERWQSCVNAGVCSAIEEVEPGRPVTNVTPDAAQRFCAFVGGRLPTTDEWVLAAAGSALRRFPWGTTGLVCRRAAFGLANGPCAAGARGPELAGARPDGATPEGVLDLAGNVAEWAKDTDGRHLALGGSYRSKVAAELRCWAAEMGSRAAHIGFRCAYGAR